MGRLFLALLLILCSCATPVLMIPGANITVPEEQGDIALTIGSGAMAVNGHAVAALSDNYYLNFDCSWSEWDSVRASFPHHSQNYMGFAINRVDRRNSFFIANGIGVGTGRIKLFDTIDEIDWEQEHDYRMRYDLLYYNMILGRKTRALEFGFAMRAGYIRLYSMDWPGRTIYIRPMDGLLVNPNGFLKFPAGPVEFYAQIGANAIYSSRFLPFSLVEVGAGIQIMLNMK